MQWIHNYQLFLFDFDGVLVNTEELHYRAYQKMCADRGFSLEWPWKTYIRAAMFESTGLKEGVYRALPALYAQEPNWDVLYAEKKQAYADLLRRREVKLMPGVESLLQALEEAKIKRCVVTHSALEQIEIISSYLPALKSIPNWITREDYSQPKPHPECYQKAVAIHALPNDKVIGFEDSPRGLKALLGSSAEGVLLSSSFTQDEIKSFVDRPFTLVPSFEEMRDTGRA